MRTAAALTLAVLLVGCSTGGSTPTAAPEARSTAPASTPASTAPTSTTTTAPTTPAEPVAVALPAVPEPTADGECPYLSSDDVAASNAERVAGVQLDPAYDPPACFFTQNDGNRQLSVWVYRAPSAAVATAAVDRAAPVESTDPAQEPAGWLGGSSGGPDGAVYAVSKDAVAVVVTTNQQQSVKARRLAEQVITTLGL